MFGDPRPVRECARVCTGRKSLAPRHKESRPEPQVPLALGRRLSFAQRTSLSTLRRTGEPFPLVVVRDCSGWRERMVLLELEDPGPRNPSDLDLRELDVSTSWGARIGSWEDGFEQQASDQRRR